MNSSINATIAASHRGPVANSGNPVPLRLSLLNQTGNAGQVLCFAIVQWHRLLISFHFGDLLSPIRGFVFSTRAYQTAASSRIAEKAASSDSSKAIDLYNRIVNGNPNQEGESGEESTTTVGGSGSRIGG